MTAESEKYEEKSLLRWSEEGQQFAIFKTIVAFANCDGGCILIESYEGDERNMDSSRICDAVNKYFSPSLVGVASVKQEDGSWLISVQKSHLAPHVATHAPTLEKNGKKKAAFHRGQVFVRHSSKTEAAGPEDFQRLIRDGVSSWLAGLGEAVARVGLHDSKLGEGIPMRIVDGGPSLNISVEQSHPYTATQLGQKHGKKGSWIGKLINREGMRGDPAYTKALPHNAGTIYLYSEAARQKVWDILDGNLNYNPYSSDDGR